jgi:hypothetical protein
MKNLSALLCGLFLVLFLSPVFSEGAAPAFSPQEWQFGTVVSGGRASATIHVANNSAAEISLSVISSCDCLRSEPSSLVIGPHAKGNLQLSFHAAEDYVGPIRMTYIIETDQKGSEPIYYRVRGNVVKKGQ